MLNKGIVLIVVFLMLMVTAFSQSDTPPKKKFESAFDKLNRKGEALFKVLPIPIVSYTTESGSIIGLGKFNVFRLSKKDSLSRPSKFTEVGTVSSMGRINLNVQNDLIFNQNNYMILSSFYYQKTPEYIYGIGNNVVKENAEQVTTDRIKFSSSAMKLVGKNYYAGVAVDFANYFNVKADSNSILNEYNAIGLDGGTDVGVGFAGVFDSRDNRYNASNGGVLLSTIVFYPKLLGTSFEFTKIDIDARRYFKPWLNHVIAVQATTSYYVGDVPFYDLAMLGGENRMRGYYKGAFRDKVLVDAQIEYRMPVWNIFGITTWVGTGRVADQYSNLSLDGFKISYGAGLRVRVDTKNNTNLRFDFGFGPNGTSGFYINFAEAF